MSGDRASPPVHGISAPKKLDAIVRAILGPSRLRRRSFEAWLACRCGGLTECVRDHEGWRLVLEIQSWATVPDEALARLLGSAYFPPENQERP